MADDYSQFTPTAPAKDSYAAFKPVMQPTPAPMIASALANDSPEQTAKVLDYSKKTSVPPSVIEADLPGFVEDNNRKNAVKAVQGNPAIASYVQKNPYGASISADDYEALGKVSVPISGLSEYGIDLATAAKLGQNVQVFSELNSGPGQGRIRGFADRIREGVTAAWGESEVDRLGKEIHGLGLNQQLLDVLEYSPVGLASKLFVNAADQALKLPGVASAAIAGGVGGVYEAFTKKAADADQLQREVKVVLDTALMDAGSRIAPSAPKLTLKNMQKYLANLPIDEAARPSQPHIDLHPDALTALKEAQAETAATTMENLVEIANQSKTRERSPEQYESFLEQHGVKTKVSLAADDIAALYEKEKKIPMEGDGLLGWIPDLAERLKTAQETGEEIKVSANKYIANIGDLHATFAEKLRVHDDGVTLAEAQVARQEASNKPITSEQAQTNALAVERSKLATEEHQGVPNTKVPEESVPLHQALSTATLPGFSVEKALDAARWAKENGRPDIAQELANRAQDLAERERKPGVTPDNPKYKQIVERLARDTEQAKIDAAKIAETGGVELRVKDKGGQPGLPTTSDPVATATIDAVAKERQSLFLDPMFTEAEAVNLPEGMFARYSRLIDKAYENILTKAVEFASREAKKRLTPEWKKNELDTETAHREAMLKMGPFAADRFFRDGTLPNGKKVISDFRVKLGDPGVIADDYAPLFGYETGSQMVADILRLESERTEKGIGPKAQFEATLKETVARSMEERFGKLADNIALEASAEALAEHNVDVLSAEVEMLARLNGREPPISRAELSSWAKDQFDRSHASVVNYETSRRAAEKAGREAEAALLKGDVIEAFKQKQRQMLAYLNAKNAKVFEKEMEKAETRYARIANNQVLETVEQTHLEQARDILAKVGYEQKYGPTRDLEPLSQFVADSEGRLAVAGWLTDGSVPPSVMEKMTVQEFRDLSKSIQSIMHVGREEKLVSNAYDKATVINTVMDIVKANERFNLIEQKMNPGIVARVNGYGRWVTAVHLLAERMFDYIDQFNPNGALTRFLDRPLRDANAKEIVLNETFSKKLRALKEFTDLSVNDKISNNVIPDPMDKSGFMNMDRGNLRQLMMHMGNESNIAKAAEGFGVKEAALRKLINENATHNDWKWVQGMWDIFAELKKETDAVELRTTGVPVDEIVAKPFDTPFGRFNGGYAPIIYDKLRSNIDATISAKNPIYEPGMFKPATSHGYTESRTAYKGPLDLAGNFMPSKIQAMIHDVAFREAINNARKLIDNPDFMASMKQKWSAEYADLLPGWLKDIANPHKIDDTYAQGTTRFLAGLRQNITSTLIALNIGTVMKHGSTALLMSAERVGVGKFGKAAADLGMAAIKESAKDLWRSTDQRPEKAFIESLQDVMDSGNKGDQTRDFILQSSAVMRNRQRQFTDSIRGAYETSSEAGTVQSLKDFRQAAMNFGRIPVALSDAVSAMPTWLAAYKEAFARGVEHDDAVFIADKEVSRAHGSSFIGDKPRVLRTGEAMRWVTPLYNFWNHMANNYFQMAWDMSAMQRGVKEGYKPEPNANIKSMSNKMFMLIVMPIIIEELAVPALDEHKGGIGKQAFLAVIKHFSSTIVGMRDVGNALVAGRDPSVGMIGTLINITASAAKDVNKLGVKGAAGKDWMPHLMTAFGAATGVGSQQIAKSASFVKDLYTGTEHPQTFNEYRQGFRTGHSKARKH